MGHLDALPQGLTLQQSSPGLFSQRTQGLERGRVQGLSQPRLRVAHHDFFHSLLAKASYKSGPYSRRGGGEQTLRLDGGSCSITLQRARIHGEQRLGPFLHSVCRGRAGLPH